MKGVGGGCGRGAELWAVHQLDSLTAVAGAPRVDGRMPSPARLISTEEINQLFMDLAGCTGAPD